MLEFLIDTYSLLLARNILLLTILATLPTNASEAKKKLAQCWAIYYHMYVNEEGLAIIQETAELLLAIGPALSDFHQISLIAQYVNSVTIRKI